MSRLTMLAGVGPMTTIELSAEDASMSLDVAIPRAAVSPELSSAVELKLGGSAEVVMTKTEIRRIG